jgi:uncharacterized protein DUF2180
MKCLDCAMAGVVSEASAACVDCGAGVCLDHLFIGRRRHAFRSSVGFGTAGEERWSRAVRCGECARVCFAEEATPWSSRVEADAHR